VKLRRQANSLLFESVSAEIKAPKKRRSDFRAARITRGYYECLIDRLKAFAAPGGATVVCRFYRQSGCVFENSAANRI
jgi:hypothetical protein